MSTDRPAPAAGPEAAPTGVRRFLPLLGVVADVALPIVLYYVLRAAGLAQLPALVLTSLVPVASVAVGYARTRRVNGFALFVGAVLLLNVAVALTSADARTLLARDGWITGMVGAFFLATVRWGRPFVLTLVRPLGEGRIGPRGVSWDVVWERYPHFRRVFRVLTTIWGVGLVVDAVVRVVMAYTLPVDLVPALGGGQYVVVYLVLQVVSQLYWRRSGLMAHPDFARPSRSDERPEGATA